MAADEVAEAAGFAEFGILGPLEVSRSGRAVPLGGPRQRAVLALLLLEANRVVSMDRLAEDVWGGHLPEGWVTTLQSYVFHLRRALEPDRARGAAGDILVTRDRGYLLRVDRDHLDAALFQDGFTAGRAALEAGRYAEAAHTLRQALGRWRSPVLADLADYAFTRPEAARLEELRLAALEARIDADLTLGQHDALTAELEQLVAEHPLRERLHGQLMLALYRSGRQADALAAYRRVRELLTGELGIDPGGPLQHLHASVLAHDPALDWSDGHPTLSAAPPPPSRPKVPASAPDASPAPGRPGPRPVVGRRELEWARRRARRLLAIGLTLAVAAAVCIVVVARPWAGEQAGLPGNSVGLIGPSGERVGAPVSVGSPAGLAYGDGAVWAVDSADGTVSRINTATHAVQQIQVGSAPTAVTVTGVNVWVTNSGDGTVSQISAPGNKVVQTIPVGNFPVAIASGRSGVWVANEGDGTVDRIDPAAGTVTRKGVQVGARPDGIAVGPDAVWVANGEDGTVTRIDPANGQPGGPLPVGSGPEGIAVTPAAVWVANSLDLTVSKVDPVTGRVIDTIPVGDGPGIIVAARNAVWVSDQFGAALDRIDPHTDQVVRTVHLGSSPQGIVWPGQAYGSARARSRRSATAAASSPRWATTCLCLTQRRRPTRQAIRYSPPPTTVLLPGADRVVRQGSRSCRIWPGRCRARPTAARHTRSRSARESVTPTARSCGHRTSAGASSASSASAPIPAITKASSAHRHATGTRGGVTCRLGLSPTTRRARLPSTWAGPTLTSCTSSRCPCHPRPARCPGPRHQPRAVPARDRPVHDLAVPAGSILYPRPEPVLPSMVVRRPASRLPVCHPVRTGVQPEKGEIGDYHRPGRSSQLDENDQSLAIQYPARIHVGLRLGTSLSSSTPTSRRLRTSRPGGPSTTPSIGPRSSSSAISHSDRPP